MDQNEDDRTTALGLFHYAHSYANAAIQLTIFKRQSTHPDAPIRFLFAHAAELFLKAFLRVSGVSVSELRGRDMGHKLDVLVGHAAQRGLDLSDESKKILATMNDAIIDRYIVTGTRTAVSVERTMQLCRELCSEIGPKVYDDAGLSRKPPIL